MNQSLDIALNLQRADSNQAMPKWSSILSNLFIKANVQRIVPGSSGAAELHGATPESILRDAVTFLGERRPSVIIDVGSGQGESTLYLGRAFPSSKVIGVELDDKMIQDSKAVLAAAEIEGVVLPGKIKLLKGNFITQCRDLYQKAELIFFFAQSSFEAEGLAQALALNVRANVPILEVGFKSQLRRELARVCSSMGRKFKEIGDPAHRYVRYFLME